MSQGAFGPLQIKSKAVSEISSRSIIQQLGSQLFWLKGKIRSIYSHHASPTGQKVVLLFNIGTQFSLHLYFFNTKLGLGLMGKGACH